MVYEKIHNSTHPCVERLDMIYKRVEKAIDALNKYYEKQEFINIAEYLKILIYDNLDCNSRFPCFFRIFLFYSIFRHNR